MPVGTKIQIRRDTAANWTSTNPTLAAGEIGFETDTLRFKVGTGSAAWTALGYTHTQQKLNLLGGGTYHKGFHSATEATGTMSSGATSYVPFYVPVTTTFDRIAIRTSGTFSGTATVRLGIYNNDASDRPSTVLLDAGTVSCTAINTTYEITISQSLNAGWYWLAANCTSAATTNSFVRFNNANQNATFLGGSSTAGGDTYWGLSETVSATSSFATAGTTAGNTGPFMIWLRK